MAFDSQSAVLDLSKKKLGLFYDTESVTLLGKYSDELAAYRGKKTWMEILGNYFLLESERDYEMSSYCDLGQQLFVLRCEFNSACGRYAFWRLMNQQAPEAEARLGGAIGKGLIKPTVLPPTNPETKNSWVFSALDGQLDDNQEAETLLGKILTLFQP